MRRIGCVVLLALVAAAAIAAEPEPRVFQLRYRAARDAATVVEPLLSGEGSVMIQPKLNRVTVRDVPPVLEAVRRALDGWDVAPVSYVINLRVLEASIPRGGAAPRKTPTISGLGAELGNLFPFSDYRELAALRIVASEGVPIEIPAGDKLHLRFTPRGQPLSLDNIDLTEFQLSRRDRGADGAERFVPMMRARVSLRLRQESVLGGAGAEDAERALFLVFLAEREDRR